MIVFGKEVIDQFECFSAEAKETARGNRGKRDYSAY